MRYALLAAAAVLLAPARSDAAVYVLTYTDSGGGVLTATVEGTPDPADSDKVLVTAVTGTTFNGNPGPALSYVVSVSSIGTLNPTAGVLTFSGTNVDFYAATPTLSDVFLFAPPPTLFTGQTTTYYGADGFINAGSVSVGGFFGKVREPYNPANYSFGLSPAAVPEPGGLALVVTGASGLLGFARRRRRAG